MNLKPILVALALAMPATAHAQIDALRRMRELPPETPRYCKVVQEFLSLKAFTEGSPRGPELSEDQLRDIIHRRRLRTETFVEQNDFDSVVKLVRRLVPPNSLLDDLVSPGLDSPYRVASSLSLIVALSSIQVPVIDQVRCEGVSW